MVWENYRNEIYNYLYRMSQKGMVVFDDIIRPVTRTHILNCLNTLNAERDKLSEVEKKELGFYLKEYQNTIKPGMADSSIVQLLKKDENGRWRTFSAKNSDFSIHADPIMQLSAVSGSGKSYLHRGLGLQFWGQVGKHIGFQFYANDITENGSGIDSQFARKSDPGYVLLSDSGNHKTLNYSEIRASIGYQWKNGSISIGQDYLLWGYGENGRMVLSDRSPAYPYIRLDYRPFRWMKFQYAHAWLNSDIIDSNRTYRYPGTTYGGQRIIYIPKFMATHSVTVTPSKGWDLSLGESIIYSDQLDIGYLVPVMFFKIYDNLRSNNNITAGSNGQFFFQASARNIFKKTHLYSTLFIDEIKIADIFNSDKSRNQIGFNIGASVTDVLIPYLTLDAEYTRVNPFVYANLIPAQTYTNHSYSLGDWMGNNFDRIILSAKYSPLPRMKWLIQYQHIRKGGPGTTDQQYFVQPQPSFLFDYQYSQDELLLQCSYEWIHSLYIQGSADIIKRTTQAVATNQSTNVFNFGIRYGL